MAGTNYTKIAPTEDHVATFATADSTVECNDLYLSSCIATLLLSLILRTKDA